MEVFEGLNWAILKKIQVIAYDDLYIPRFKNPVNYEEILIESGKNFEEITHIFESAGFRENEKITAAGHKWEKEVKLRVPKLRTGVTSFLNNYSVRKLALLVTDMNGITHLVFPLRMTRRRNIPGQATGLNATEVIFSGEWINVSPIVVNMS